MTESERVEAEARGDRNVTSHSSSDTAEVTLGSRQKAGIQCCPSRQQ